MASTNNSKPAYRDTCGPYCVARTPVMDTADGREHENCIDQCGATWGAYESPVYRCDRIAGHDGSHSAVLSRSDDGEVDEVASWA